MRNDQQNAHRILFGDEYTIDSSDHDGRALRSDDRNEHRLRTSDESNGTNPAHTGRAEPRAEPAEPRADDEHRAGREQR